MALILEVVVHPLELLLLQGYEEGIIPVLVAGQQSLVGMYRQKTDDETSETNKTKLSFCIANGAERSERNSFKNKTRSSLHDILELFQMRYPDKAKSEAKRS